MKLNDHPTVKRYRERASAAEQDAAPLDAGWLRQLCLEAGADDAGFGQVAAADVEDLKDEILALFPRAKSFISLVTRLNRDALRSPTRSLSDHEYLWGLKRLDEAGRQIVFALHDRGVRAVAPPGGFPMDLEHWPEKMWPLSHKKSAEAAGMGRRGHHRLVTHPRFGSHILLSTVLLDREISAYTEKLDFDPCLDCKLCHVVCPLGAVAKDGHFGFVQCFVHNYQDRLAGFVDWVEQVVEARSRADYRRRVSDSETVAMWQGLTYGVSNKCSYCMAVCPAGEEIIGDYLDDKKGFNRAVVQPLKDRQETVYVVPGSDGEAHVKKRFPHKRLKQVGSGLRPRTIAGFIEVLPRLFNREQAAGFQATYHFTFTGREPLEATVVIDDRTIAVSDGHVGQADLRLRADSDTWLSFLAKEQNLLAAMLLGRIRVSGSPKLMQRFAACFPL